MAKSDNWDKPVGLDGLELHMQALNLNDFRLLYCGYEKCTPAHIDGPGMRDHYVMHYILSGKGIFKSGKKTFSLQKGLAFIIYPETPVYYCSDKDDPWEYIWVAFKGQTVLEMLQKTLITSIVPVVSFKDPEKITEMLLKLLHCANEGAGSFSYDCYGIFLELMGHIIRTQDALPVNVIRSISKSLPETHIENAIAFIKGNISKPFTASDVANYLGLNRSYFYTIFEDIYGVAPTDFINGYRMNMAWHLLHTTDLTVNEISGQVGFEDPSYFTRRFKKHYGLLPNLARKVNLGSTKGEDSSNTKK